MQKNNSTKVLRVAYPITWGSLIPPLQHTLVGDAIISNEFEPLVQYGSDGVIQPLACSSFTISSDFKKYKFMFKEKKFFSDGTELTSKDFKRSFEHGLKLKKISSNESSLDGLYQLDGFESFDKNGSISGIIADDPNVLELHYKKPFRMALEHLTGPRFSAYKINREEKYLGTGPWVIVDPSNTSKIHLEPNPYSIIRKNFKIEIIADQNYIEKLKEDEIDVAEILDFNIQDCPKMKESNIKCLLGDDESHVVLHLNQMQNRVFEKTNHRKALLFLMSKLLQDPSYRYRSMNYLSEVDMQFFLPFQKGRIQEEDADAIIRDGSKYVEALKNETAKKPLFFATARKDLFILDFLKSQGLHFTQNSGFVPFSEIVEMGYKTSEADMLFLSFSVVSGDPDGLYHALGKNGAISFPMSFNKIVGDILEDGRTLIDEDKIKKKYEQLNYALLNEVPVVQLGFQRQVSLYHADRVKIQNSSPKRHDHRLIVYSLK